MKCPNCPTFTGKEVDNEPEGSLDIDAHGFISGDVRIHNDCVECGTELEESTFSVEIDMTKEAAEHWKSAHDGKKYGLSVDAEITRTDETSTTDHRGKPITNPRYRKRMYGIEVEAKVACDECGDEFANGRFKDATQASGMEWIA